MIVVVEGRVLSAEREREEEEGGWIWPALLCNQIPLSLANFRVEKASFLRNWNTLPKAGARNSGP